jgi:hypothetical protein
MPEMCFMWDYDGEGLRGVLASVHANIAHKVAGFVD